LDLKVTYIQDVLNVSEATVLNTVPKTIDIRGSDFRSAAMVRINGDLAPSFTVHSDSRLTAFIPSEQQNESVNDIAVISGTFTAKNRSLVSLELGSNPQLTSGLFRLMQRFILLLLRNPGTDILNPESGGGMGKLSAQFSMGAQSVTAADIALAVTRTKKQILKLQATNPYLKTSERLADAELLGVEYLPTYGSLSPRVKITSQEGLSAIATMEAE
jgi:hypothetical protein